jgi:hypothetical protein
MFIQNAWGANSYNFIQLTREQQRFFGGCSSLSFLPSWLPDGWRAGYLGLYSKGEAVRLFQRDSKWPVPKFYESNQSHFLFIITPSYSGSTALSELLNYRTTTLQAS